MSRRGRGDEGSGAPRSPERTGLRDDVPIIDEDDTVLCGNGRLAAARQMGLVTVPTIRLSHMTEAQKRAYILADNRIAEQASWSRRLLKAELQGLIDVGYEVELSGFDTLEIDTLLSLDDADEKVDDDVHLPDERTPVCRAGNLWHIGRYCMYVGDARQPIAYEHLLAGERAQLVFTDRPMAAASRATYRANVSGNGRVSTPTSSRGRPASPTPSSRWDCCARRSN